MYLVTEFKIIFEPIYETDLRTYIFKNEENAHKKAKELVDENLNSEYLAKDEEYDYYLTGDSGSFVDISITKTEFED